MTYSYRRTNLVCVTPQYTVVPEEVFTDKQKTNLLSFTFSAPENKCLHNLLTREAAEVVFGMDEEVYEFCSPLADQSVVYPSYDSPAGFMETAEPYVDPRQLYVVLHRKMMDVVCFAQGKLLLSIRLSMISRMISCTIYYMYGNRSAWIRRGISFISMEVSPCVTA